MRRSLLRTGIATLRCLLLAAAALVAAPALSGRRPASMRDMAACCRRKLLADRGAHWKTFFGSSEWKALTGNPRYNFEALPSRLQGNAPLTSRHTAAHRQHGCAQARIGPP